MELASGGHVQGLVVDEFHKVAEEDAVEQSAVALGSIAQHTAVARHVLHYILRSLYGIGKILLVARNLVQFVRGAEKGSLIVGENPFAVYLAVPCHVVRHGSRRLEEGVLEPMVDFLGFRKVLPAGFLALHARLVIEVVQACGNDGGRTVGAGVLRFLHIGLPRDAAVPRRFVLGTPLCPNPIVIHLHGLLQILLVGGAFVHPYLREHHPFHVVHKRVPPRVFLASCKVELRRALPPQGVHGKILLVPGAHVGIHNHVHGMGLRPIMLGGHVAHVAAIVEIVALLVARELRSPKAFDEGVCHAVRHLLPIGMRTLGCEL